MFSPYQLRTDLALTNFQRATLLHAFDELVFAIRAFRKAKCPQAARRTARHTQRLVKAFGEKRNAANDPCPMHPAYSYHDCPQSHAYS